MMEPNLWLDFGAWGAAAMTNHGYRRRRDDNGDDDDGLGATIAFLRKWTHPSITITLLIFAFGQYEAAQKRDAEQEKELALIRSEMHGYILSHADAHAAQREALAYLSKAQDVDRATMTRALAEINDHFAQDDRRFRAAGLR